MKPLRVLMVSEPGIDGVFTVVDSLIRHLHDHHPEISVDLAYSSRRSGQALRDLIGTIERRGDRTIDLNVGNAPSPSDLRAIRDLVRFTRQRKHHVVHAHSSKAGALARIARLSRLIPKVFYSPHAYYGMPELGGPKEKLFNAIESLLGRVGTTINCSEDERDFAVRVLHVPPARLRVIHNGIDTARFSPPDAAGKAAARTNLGLPHEGKLLITIGRDSVQKNYGPLYATLDDLLPSAEWSFAHAGAGSTALRDRLCQAAADRCHSFEHLDDVVPLLQAADGFVMTSRYEGLSLAMLSGLSCGLPAFLSDVPGFHFLKEFGFGEIAWLPETVSPERVGEALKNALRSWAAQPPGILTRQRELVCRMFSSRDQLEKFVALYQG